MLYQIAEQKQDDRNWQFAQHFKNPLAAYDEMTAAVELALDPSTDINNLPKETQDWLRKT